MSLGSKPYCSGFEILMSSDRRPVNARITDRTMPATLPRRSAAEKAADTVASSVSSSTNPNVAVQLRSSDWSIISACARGGEPDRSRG